MKTSTTKRSSGPELHPAAHAFVADQVRRLGPFDEVLDLGGRDVNGSVRDLFPGARYVVVDVRPGPGVTVVADAADWRAEEPFGCVVCCEVLEHTARAAEIVASGYANLRAGGVLMVTTAMEPRVPHSAVDGCGLRFGEYYRNVDPETLEMWLAEAGFDQWEVASRVIPGHGGDLYAVAWR